MPAKPKSKTPEVIEPTPAPVVEAAPVIDAPVPEESGVTVNIPEASPAAIELDAFVAKIMEERNKPEPVYVPPTPHPRQLEQTRLEMEAGAKRVAENEAERVHRPVAAPDPGQGTTVPVYRPVDFVPGMDKGNVSARSV